MQYLGFALEQRRTWVKGIFYVHVGTATYFSKLDSFRNPAEASRNDRVFLEKKTFCLGCYMARFCTLKDVVQVYGLETETLVQEIQQAAINKTFQNNKE